jgi:hypothetical protein
MKEQNVEQNDEPLSKVLGEWKVKSPLPPRFQTEVWRRIESRQTQSAIQVPWLSRLMSTITRPALAASYLAVLLLGGVLAGYWQARITNAHAEAVLSARYVEAVDPYQVQHE